MNAKGLRIALVGPLPPPSGGMANQTLQLARLLGQEGVEVELVQVNAPYRPRAIGAFRGVRALFRLVPYLLRLWHAAGRVQLYHIMANSGWSWHLNAAPAVWIARLRRIPAVVNYRGGGAEEFFARSIFWVRPTMRLADRLVVPSGFLQDVFRRFGLAAEIVPNVIDLGRFVLRPERAGVQGAGPHLIVTRNLEEIYDIGTALRALAIIHKGAPAARMTIAGSGPERERLVELARTLGIAGQVTFTGRLDNERIVELYQQADVFINPSLVDNMPISVLESLASGVPVVSTDVGGVRFVVEHGKTALLVPPGDPEAMARAVLQLIEDPDQAGQLARAGRESVQQYAWSHVRNLLLGTYLGLAARAGPAPAAGVKSHRSAYTALCSEVVFPLHELLKRHDSRSRRSALEETQWWSPARIEEHRVQRLREFLTTAASTVPYYGELFRAARFDPRSIKALSDLAAIPLLTKPAIRSNLDRLKARGATGLARFNTGGSSGEPLVFFIGRDRISHDVAAKWRATRWWGVDIGDPEIVVWGSPIELGAQDWVRSVRDRMLRTTLLPAFEMSEAKLDAFVAAIRARRPAMMFGYPSALAHIARHAASRNQRLDDLGVRAAFVTSERLYPEQRASISRAFGCPVANGYGGRDAGFIAHECPSGGMHITAEDIVVEIVDGAGVPQAPGVAGEIVVTHMATGTFPFIRYRTGDVGVLDSRACACGRGLPLIGEIQGRTTDFVVARDGTVMHGLALVYVVRDLPGIRKFKIVQESLEHTRVLLAVDPEFDLDNVARIRASMAQRLGQQVRIDVDMVADIPAEASGKFRYVISKAVPA